MSTYDHFYALINDNNISWSSYISISLRADGVA